MKCDLRGNGNPVKEEYYVEEGDLSNVPYFGALSGR
jgi:hypothetical protein